MLCPQRTGRFGQGRTYGCRVQWLSSENWVQRTGLRGLVAEGRVLGFGAEGTELEVAGVRGQWAGPNWPQGTGFKERALRGIRGP